MSVYVCIQLVPGCERRGEKERMYVRVCFEVAEKVSSIGVEEMNPSCITAAEPGTGAKFCHSHVSFHPQKINNRS